MESCVRKELKAQLAIRHGGSSRQIEAALKSAAFVIQRRMCPLEKEDLLDNGEWPSWWNDADVLECFAWDVLVLLKRKEPGPRPPVPECVPAQQGRVGVAKPKLSRGFDLFCYLNSEELEARLYDRRLMNKFEGKSRKAQLKMAGGELWKTIFESQVGICSASTRQSGATTRRRWQVGSSTSG